jgi:hypothetical protein
MMKYTKKKKKKKKKKKQQQTSSVNILCQNLEAGPSVDRILVGVRFFAHVQVGPGTHLASCTMGTGSFPG